MDGALLMIIEYNIIILVQNNNFNIENTNIRSAVFVIHRIFYISFYKKYVQGVQIMIFTMSIFFFTL